MCASFKKISSAESIPESPESLFHDLKVKRSPDIQGMWSYQADILREYHNVSDNSNQDYANSTDLAFELPTGTGKTLVGLLIGDYRRRKYKERVLYLCSTKQLAYQVYNKSKEYGIETNL